MHGRTAIAGPWNIIRSAWSDVGHQSDPPEAISDIKCEGTVFVDTFCLACILCGTHVKQVRREGPSFPSSVDSFCCPIVF